ncbi:MAG: hypothetical protein O7C75_11395 [Verrucomicrobia bacterium]|nr:hypothetical protein [Verrucomicrobiota bacterium]
MLVYFTGEGNPPEVLLKLKLRELITGLLVRNENTEVQFDCGTANLETGAEIQVDFNAVTNGNIPENDETAYSRGR